jgi:hypothetical protein
LTFEMKGVSSVGRGMQKGMHCEEDGKMLPEMGSVRLIVVLTYIREVERFADLRICSDRFMDMFEARLEQRPFLKAPMTPSLSLRMRMSALEMPNWKEMQIANSTAIVSSQPISSQWDCAIPHAGAMHPKDHSRICQFWIQ